MLQASGLSPSPPPTRRIYIRSGSDPLPAVPPASTDPKSETGSAEAAPSDIAVFLRPQLPQQQAALPAAIVPGQPQIQTTALKENLRRFLQASAGSLNEHAQTLQPLADSIRKQISEQSAPVAIKPLRPAAPAPRASLTLENPIVAELFENVRTIPRSALGVKHGAAARMIEQLEALIEAKAKGNTAQQTKALLLMMMYARQLEAESPDLAKKWGVSEFNRGMGALVDGLAREISCGNPASEQALKKIFNRYLGRAAAGENARSAGADAHQRINDLCTLLDMLEGNTDFDAASAGRIIYEMMLDQGADGAVLVKQALAGLRAKLNPEQRRQLDSLVLECAVKVFSTPQLRVGLERLMNAMTDPSDLQNLFSAVRKGGDETLQSFTANLLARGGADAGAFIRALDADGMQALLKAAHSQGPEAVEKLLALTAAQGDEALERLIDASRKLGPDVELRLFDAVFEGASKAHHKAQKILVEGLGLGGRLKAAVLDSLKAGPELARYLTRFLLDDSAVGRVAHTLDILRTLADTRLVGMLLGEKHRGFVKDLVKLLALDDFMQNQLNTIFDPANPGTPAQKVEAIKHLYETYRQRFQAFSEARAEGKVTSQAAPPSPEGKAEALRPDADAPAKAGKAPPQAPPKAPALKAPPSDWAGEIDAPPRQVSKGTEASEVLIKAERSLLDKARARGVSEANLARLKAMAKQLGPDGIEGLGRLLDKLDRGIINLAVESFEVMMQEALGVMSPAKFKAAVFAESSLQVLKEAFQGLGKALSQLGVANAPGLASKVGPGLLRALPLLGGAFSLSGAVHLGEIALTGESKGKKYRDPNVRALALLGAAINSADTALALAEFCGIGNLGIGASIAMAVVTISLEVAVDYYRDHPMPPKLAASIRRNSALAAAGSAATTLPTLGTSLPIGAGMLKIYGAKALVRELMDQGAEGIAALGRLASQGGEIAVAARAALKAIAVKSGRLANLALDELAKQGRAGARDLAELLLTTNGLEAAVITRLRAMGQTGREALQEMFINLWQSGSKGLDRLTSLYRELGLSEVKDFVMGQLQKAWATSSLSNNFAGLRELLDRLQATASADARSFIEDMLRTFDREYAGDKIPDWLYERR